MELLRKLGFLGVSLHLTAFTASATVILALITRDQVTIVADSKPTFRGMPGPQAVCKITPVRSGFLAISGLEHDTLRDFDSRKVATEAFESAGGFLFWVAASEVFVRNAAEVEMRRLRTEDPEAYRFTIKHDSSILGLVFVSFDKIVPRLAIRQLRYDEQSGRVEISAAVDCPGKDCPEGHYLAYLAPSDGVIERFVKANGRPQLNVDVLRDLVSKQIQATPDEVGPPVEILTIDRGGPRWVANELDCPLDSSPEK